jgi:hypothetical protein
MDLRFRSDPLKLRVQFIAQLDECVAGHALMPLLTQLLNHFRKPDSMRAARGHVGTIVLRDARPQKSALMCGIIGCFPKPIGLGLELWQLGGCLVPNPKPRMLLSI